MRKFLLLFIITVTTLGSCGNGGASYKNSKHDKDHGKRKGCVCNDGTRSSATGRGACSHHGGVDYWIYE